ncbi:Non-histone chromosomal protein 6 [Actinomortierella ambigua]|uniref:Non-histone chromosomal protein 6 n=1 Tax=Actinomortierella ambigua TaxID=1343610 RepID=A0A9P6U9K0_9FUNG|nr:Non-histone chromosomal protein 6 [Actinomortierella ambigua]
MTNPSPHFDTEPSLMTSQNTTPGSTYGGYNNLYGNLNNSMTFNHPSSYPGQSSATPPLLPPLQSNPYAPDNSNFAFHYQSDVGSIAGAPTPVSAAASGGSAATAAAGNQPSPAANTPGATTTSSDPLDASGAHLDSRRSMDEAEARRLQLPHPQQILDDAHQKQGYPSIPQQQQTSVQQPQQSAQQQQATAATPQQGQQQQQQQQQQHSPHPQQALSHQQTPQQSFQQQQAQQQHQQLQRHMHPNQLSQSPYQQFLPHHHTPGPTSQFHHQQAMMYGRPEDKSPGHVGMPHMMQTHNMYGADTRHDGRLQQPGQSAQAQSAQRYVDPNMSMGRNGAPRPGEVAAWNGQNVMMSMGMVGAGTPGGGGPIRHAPGGVQGRGVAKQRSRDFGAMDPSLGGLGGGAMAATMGMGMGGIPGMGGIGGVGGMVGANPNPYAPGVDHYHPGQHAQHALQQQHLAQQQQQQQQQQLRGMAGPPGRVMMSPELMRNGGGITKKKLKKAVPAVVKDKNGPKRPRNSYIFFTLMKRDDIKKKHPEFKPTEITKMLGEEWQKLSDAEKESYGAMAEDDKKRYQSEMEAYDATNMPNVVDNNMTWRM